MSRTSRVAAGLSTLLFCSTSFLPAQDKLTENTLKLMEGTAGPPARVTDFAWLEGHWQAEALGGTVDEIWSSPAAGTMVGMFRLVKDDEVSFYEIFTITEEGSTALLRLKHFNADLTGWEEKNDTVDFPLVALEEGRASFDGLTYRRRGKEEMEVFLAMRTKDGVREVHFAYKRVGAE